MLYRRSAMGGRVSKARQPPAVRDIAPEQDADLAERIYEAGRPLVKPTVQARLPTIDASCMELSRTLVGSCSCCVHSVPGWQLLAMPRISSCNRLPHPTLPLAQDPDVAADQVVKKGAAALERSEARAPPGSGGKHVASEAQVRRCGSRPASCRRLVPAASSPGRASCSYSRPPLQAVGGQAPARPGAAPGGGDCEGEGCHGSGALQAGRASRRHSAGVASTRACAHVHACAGWLLDPPAWSPSKARHS